VAPPGIRLLALDIDGTIAPEVGLPAPRIVDAIRATHAAGVEVMLVTGRPAHAVRGVAAALGLDELWVGSSNGAVLSRATPQSWEIVARETFDPRDAVAAVQALDPNAAIVVEEPGVGFRVSRSVPTAIGQEPHLPFGSVPATATLVALASRLAPAPQLLAAVAGVDAYVMPWRHQGWEVLDISPSHVSKATAVRTLAQRRAVLPEECAAVGDYLNDIAMLEWAGWGVAMGHAPALVREAADAVAPDFSEDGVLAVLAAISARR